MRGIHQSLGRAELAFGVNDLGPLFALRLRLLGHGAQHRFRHVDLLHFHVRHFYAPRRSVLVQNALQAQIDFLPMRQKFVEFLLAQHRAQSCLRKLRRLVDVV